MLAPRRLGLPFRRRAAQGRGVLLAVPWWVWPAPWIPISTPGQGL